QALRVVAYLLALSALLIFEVGGDYVPIVLLVGEITLMLFLLPFIRGSFRLVLGLPDKTWTAALAVFGRDGFLIGLLADVLVKVDIIMLGFYVSDSDLGLYVFMALFAEGLGQI